ncbi:hypothetical protein QCA50_013100 [Cerrena zonata]|uniref:G-protein coupled receptors family 1 profile domain-containing protein n=1 Tax=Cerrena zonata TaxID=2478898 RepID=A0AAW0FZY6_9APHY
MASEMACDAPPNSLAAAAVWLPMNVAPWYEATKCVCSAILGALFWDIIMSSGEDIKMFKKGPFNTANAVYVLSRVVTLTNATAALIFYTASHISCSKAFQIVAWLGAFAAPINALLFLIRVTGVYHDSRPAIMVFTILWLSTLTSLAAPWGFHGIKIGPTSFCIPTGFGKFDGVPFILITIFDTVVFIAITIRVLSISMVNTWRSRLRAFTSGQGMGKLTGALLQTGQLYYLVTVGVNFASVIILLGGIGEPAFQTMVTMVNIALQNAMACRVFRLLKLGVIHDTPTSFGDTTPVAFAHDLMQLQSYTAEASIARKESARVHIPEP